MTPLRNTDPTKFAPDKDPSTTTNPNSDLTDTDSLKGGLEDKNRDGRVDSGETNPNLEDTDGDGLSDSVEDANANGIQDKLADGTLQETDPLAKDSDLDGLDDGAEVAGTWCYAGGSCTGNGALDPKNADSDGDWLRDGQEAAGWRVVVWYERTIERKTDYVVTSDPRDGHTDTDGDGLNDFSEFLNGSDPRKSDTDDDLIPDYNESVLKSNLTGIEGSPPQITGLQLSVSVILSQLVPYIWVPTGTAITIDFDVSDNVGVDVVTVKLTHAAGTLNHTAQIAKGSTGGHVKEVFTLGIAQSILTAGLTGADLNLSAVDRNGNGAWGQFHVDSVAQAVVKEIVAYFAAIASVVAEAASQLLQWIIDSFMDALMALIKPVVDGADSWMGPLASGLLEMIDSVLEPSRSHQPNDISHYAPLGVQLVSIIEVIQVGVLLLTSLAILIELAIIAGTAGTAVAFKPIVAMMLLGVMSAAGLYVAGGFEILGSGHSAMADELAAQLDGGAGDPQNQITSRELMISVFLLVWDFLTWVLIRLLVKPKAPLGVGFAIAMFSLILNSLVYRIQTLHPVGKVKSVMAGASFVTFAFAAIGAGIFFTKELAIDTLLSTFLSIVKTAITISSLGTGLVLVLVSAKQAFDCGFTC